MKIPKPATRLRKGDQLVLPHPIRIGETSHTSGRVARVQNSPYGYLVQYTAGGEVGWVQVGRGQIVEVIV